MGGVGWGGLPWGSARKLQLLRRSSEGRCAGRRRHQDWSALRSSRDAPSLQRGWGRSQRWTTGYVERGLLQADGGRVVIRCNSLSGRIIERKKKQAIPTESLHAWWFA